MKSINVVAVAIFVALLSLNSASAVDSAARKTSVISSLSSMSLAFTENQGQWPDSILFRANAGGATMWFTKNGAYYQFTRRIPNNCERQMSTSAPFSDHQPDHIETMMIKADFVGSNPTPRVVGEGLLDYKCNYFLGNDPAKWRTDVPNYSAIVYQDIYPGIDLKYYGSGKQMEYDFIVSPGADFSQIRIQYEGVKSLSVDGAGCLVVETEWGTVTELRPLVYQMERGERLLTAGEYTLLGENRFGFRLKGGYNPALTLVIDPILSYSTYLGGESDDEGHGIAVDNSGNAYVTGRTLSTNFPTQNAYQTDQPGWDVFVTKFSATGDSLIYSTYLGGNGANGDCGYGIAVDDTGNAYVTGYTYSANFPTTPDAYDNSKNGLNDVFVTKLSPSGNLVYSTYLGGAGSDDGYGIAVDDSGNAYVTGWTHSSNFPTTDCAYDTIFNGSDVFVTKFSATGDSLVYSTFLGKWGGEMGYGIAVDTSGNAYVTGWTHSDSFPTTDCVFDDTLNDTRSTADAFVTKFSANGCSLVYSTYLGDADAEEGRGITVDAAGNAYVTGYTESYDFPTTPNVPQGSLDNDKDAFVTKLSATGTSLVYSTYLGGVSGDEGYGIAVDTSGNAYVTGHTGSSNFPVVDPIDDSLGGWEAFVTKLCPAGTSWVYSTFLGGLSSEYGRSIAVDTDGDAYVTGYTYSTDFPTLNPYQGTNQGSLDVFVTKLSESCCNTDGIRGDVDMSGTINVADVTYLVAYLKGLGPAPTCNDEADVDGSGTINVADVTYLVAYLKGLGPAPPACP